MENINNSMIEDWHKISDLLYDVSEDGCWATCRHCKEETGIGAVYVHKSGCPVEKLSVNFMNLVRKK